MMKVVRVDAFVHRGAAGSESGSGAGAGGEGAREGGGGRWERRFPRLELVSCEVGLSIDRISGDSVASARASREEGGEEKIMDHLVHPDTVIKMLQRRCLMFWAQEGAEEEEESVDTCFLLEFAEESAMREFREEYENAKLRMAELHKATVSSWRVDGAATKMEAGSLQEKIKKEPLASALSSASISGGSETSGFIKSSVESQDAKFSFASKTEDKSLLQSIAKQQVGETWKCSECSVQNKLDATVCAACQTPRQPKPPPESAKIDFGGNSTTTGTSNFSFAPKTEDKSLLQNIAKQQVGETWKCSECSVQNKLDVTVCAACQTPRQPKPPPESAKIDFGGNSTKSTTAAPTFNFSQSASSAKPPNFLFSGVSAPPSNLFGPGTTSTSQAPSFSFGPGPKSFETTGNAFTPSEKPQSLFTGFTSTPTTFGLSKPDPATGKPGIEVSEKSQVQPGKSDAPSENTTSKPSSYPPIMTMGAVPQVQPGKSDTAADNSTTKPSYPPLMTMGAVPQVQPGKIDAPTENTSAKPSYPPIMTMGAVPQVQPGNTAARGPNPFAAISLTQPTTKPAPAKQEESSSGKAQFEPKLKRFYEKYCKENISKIPKILVDYEGRYDQLVEKLLSKYGGTKDDFEEAPSNVALADNDDDEVDDEEGEEGDDDGDEEGEGENDDNGDDDEDDNDDDDGDGGEEEENDEDKKDDNREDAFAKEDGQDRKGQKTAGNETIAPPSFTINLTGAPKAAVNIPPFGQTSAPKIGQTTESLLEQTSTPLFGQTPIPPFGQTSTPAFGQTSMLSTGQTTAPLFGQTSTPLFGQTSTSLFGQASTPVFGQKSMISTPTTTTAPSLGTGAVQLTGAGTTAPFGSFSGGSGVSFGSISSSGQSWVNNNNTTTTTDNSKQPDPTNSG